MKNVNWTFVFVALILGLSVLGFGALDYVSKHEQLTYQQKLEEQKNTQITQNKESLDACIENVKEKARERWNNTCKAKGLNENCLQSMDIVNSYQKAQEVARNECFKKHPIQ